MNRVSLFWTLLACAAMAAVTAAADLADDKPADKANESAKQFQEQLLEIAKSYKKLGPVDFQGRFGPEDCRAPTPAPARLSDSKDGETHGRQLYYLFAKDRYGYLALGNAPAKRLEIRGVREEDSKALPEKLRTLAQFVVKESWVPEEVPEIDRRAVRPFQSTDPYATRDGKTYKTGKQGDLFIMLKLDPKTPATDNGWVYGTVTADGKKVTSAGRVESCMSCHKEAKHDRLFGLAKPESAEKTEKDKK